MLMLIRQFQFTGIAEEELEIIPDFCEWLCQQMYSYIDNKINRRKIQLRLNYIYQVSWIEWKKNKYIGVSEIMEAINKSFSYEEYRNNTWKIQTNSKVLIPESNTLMDRLIRFIEFGDQHQRGTGMFTGLKKHYDASKLNTLWRMYKSYRLGTYLSDVKIITD